MCARMRAVYARAHVRVCVRVCLCIYGACKCARVCPAAMRNSRHEFSRVCVRALAMHAHSGQADSQTGPPLQQRPNREQTVDRLRRRFLFRRRAALQLTLATLTHPIAPHLLVAESRLQSGVGAACLTSKLFAVVLALLPSGCSDRLDGLVRKTKKQPTAAVQRQAIRSKPLRLIVSDFRPPPVCTEYRTQPSTTVEYARPSHRRPRSPMQ